MPDFVCVDIIVDTQDLLSAYPEPSQDPTDPTVVETGGCYLIAPPVYTRRGQATAHLHVALASAPSAADDSDTPADPTTIQWRAFSLSGNTGQSAILYDLEPMGDAPAPSRAEASEIPAPRPILVNASNTDPPTFEAGVVHDYFIETPILGQGAERFRVQFYVTQADPETGALVVVGYFTWTSVLSIRFD